MSNKKDLNPRKNGQIKVLLKEMCLEKEDIAKKLNISSLSVSFIKKKDERSVYPDSKKKKKCGRKKMTTPKMNKRIINMAVKNRRLPC